MDKWTPAQIDRMKAGGNAKCKEFFEANGQPFKSMPITEKVPPFSYDLARLPAQTFARSQYNTHIASMYRDKLVCDAEGRPWVPTSPDPNASANTGNGGATGLGSSTGSLRKPRNSNFASSAASSSGPSSRTGSPANANGLPSRAQNEDFFARMGAANDSRPDHLPPSQGGKYGGFGSGGPGPSASRGSSNPLSSRNLPGMDDLRDDPMSALNKGWGFLGAALGAFGKTVNE